MDEELSPGWDQDARASRHQRGEPRDSLFLQAPMRLSGDAHPVLLRVRNLSAGGLMADSPIAIERGQEVEVELRNVGVVGGEVVWVEGRRIGIAFHRRVDPRLARTPVGTHAADATLIRPSSQRSRRSGLRIE